AGRRFGSLAGQVRMERVVHTAARRTVAIGIPGDVRPRAGAGSHPTSQPSRGLPATDGAGARGLFVRRGGNVFRGANCVRTPSVWEPPPNRWAGRSVPPLGARAVPIRRELLEVEDLPEIAFQLFRVVDA